MSPSDQRTALHKASPAPRKYSFFGHLRVRLLLLILIALLPALGLVIYHAVEIRRIGLEAAQKDAFLMANVASAKQDELIEGAKQILQTLAQLEPIKVLDAQGTKAILYNVLRLNTVYENLGLVTPEGQLIATGLTSADAFSMTNRSFFKKAVQQKAFTIGDYELEDGNGMASLHAAYPVEKDSGELAGVLIISMKLDWLFQLYIDANLPTESSFTVYNQDRITLARFPDPTQDYIGQIMGGSSPPTSRQASSARRPTQRSNISIGRDGVRRLYVSTPLGRHQGEDAVRITFGIPVALAFAESNVVLWRNLIILTVVMLLTFSVAWFGGDFFMLRKVRNLITATQLLRQGDLSARTGESSARGELEDLGRIFDDMASSLERQFAERSKAELALRTLNNELESRVEDRTTQLQRSNEDLQQFAYVASHDLQEPLRMITSYLELLKKRYQDKLDQDANEFIGFAVDGATRMHRLINDLLAYSRIQTKARPFETVDLNEIFSQVTANLQIAIKESGTQIEKDPLPTIQGDPSQLTQLFQNLLSNAIKFRRETPPSIHIKSESSPTYWTISVSDNGLGISQENFERIFVIFQRLHGRQDYPGTGIGLTVCKKVVERHGGRIWIESTPGQGTTFHFTIPKSSPPQDQPDRVGQPSQSVA